MKEYKDFKSQKTRKPSVKLSLLKMSTQTNWNNENISGHSNMEEEAFSGPTPR